jgi:ferredoxin-NADP reductase/CRP-like cAMP-binding protein
LEVKSTLQKPMPPEVCTFLKKISIFRALDDFAINLLANSSNILNLDPGEIFLKENEIADSMFLILEGSIEIYSFSEDGKKVNLASLEKGSHFGEQALLPKSRGERNANARAIEKSVLVEVSKGNFLKTIESDPETLTYLNKTGKEQIKRKLEATSSAFRSLSIPESYSQWIEQKKFLDGEEVFREGEAGDSFYLILSGQAVAHKTINGEEKILTKYGSGSFFGELALIKNEPRSATVKADGTLNVISLEGEHFIKLYKDSPNLKEQFEHLQSIYKTEGSGVLTVHTGKHMDMDALTSIYHGLDGHDVATIKVKEKPIVLMTRVQVGTKKEKICEEVYEENNIGISRTLQITEGQLIGANIYGNWDQMGQVFQYLIHGNKLRPWQLALFRTEGNLSLGQKNGLGDATIICNCNQVSLGCLKKALLEGCDNFDSVTKKTGACLVCGSCGPKITNFLGHSNMEQAVKTEEFEVTSEVKTFQLKPNKGEVFPSKPGQNISIEAMIGGEWVRRAYTLTSPSGQKDYYEITVKKEYKGVFSNWLHEKFKKDSIVRISKPHGSFYLDTQENKTVVCLCAGIGVTPFLAMIRTMAKTNDSRKLHLIYSARTEDLFSYSDELKKYTKRFRNITVDFHETSKKGRVNKDGLNEIAKNFPDSIFFICGPEKFQESTKEILAACGISKNRINVESFEVQKKASERPSLKAPKMLTFASILTLTVSALFFLFPSWKAISESGFEELDPQIVSGYSILGLVSFAMFFSIHKRTNFWRFINFEYIRILHIVLGILSLLALGLHTGMHLGSNLNFLLMFSFLLTVIFGGLAGYLIYLENIKTEEYYFRFRELFKTIHWAITWPLPILLGLHILSIYYF